MKTLTDQKVQGFGNEITVIDEPGHGGACHEYLITGFDPPRGQRVLAAINFQNGPVKEFGINGCQIEDLLAVNIHRLECFQAGPFSNPKNQEALEHCRSALKALQHRTLERLSRGVEGRSKE